jgi:hypothetical protein
VAVVAVVAVAAVASLSQLRCLHYWCFGSVAGAAVARFQSQALARTLSPSSILAC